MQRALPAADDDAAQAVLIQGQPAQQAPPIIAQSNFIPVLLWQSAQAEVDPAGEFAFAQRIAPGDGLHALPAFIEKFRELG